MRSAIEEALAEALATADPVARERLAVAVEEYRARFSRSWSAVPVGTLGGRVLAVVAESVCGPAARPGR